MFFKKFLILVAIYSLSFGAFAEKTEVSSGQYYAGGIVSIFLPWGIGHAIQGRYGEMGWIFTLSELAASSLMTGGVIWVVSSLGDNKFSEASSGQYSKGGAWMTAFGGLAMVGFRIWEIADAWAGATPVEMVPKSAESYLNKNNSQLWAHQDIDKMPSLSMDFISFNF